MKSARLYKFRVLRPLMIAGRIRGVAEIVWLPFEAALEYVGTGHLVQVDAGDDD